MDRGQGRLRHANSTASIVQIGGLISIGAGLVLAPWWAVLLLVGFVATLAGTAYELGRKVDR